jgi:guanine deaminase
LAFLKDAVIAVGADGVISEVAAAGDPRHQMLRDAAQKAGTLVELPRRSVVLPGFVDLHVHAPQYPQLGTALDVPLETWLQRYTFPLEARYADAAFARRQYGVLVDDLLACGTTTAVYFATIHQAASRILADICLEKGQRALVGKVAMDNRSVCPDYYRDDSADAALGETRAFIDYVRSHPDNAGLVEPVVTPRFIPSCTDPLLDGLGAIARECECAVQTHCSESDWEHDYVLARHGVTDTQSLDRFGLLTRRTVLAHANFISTADMALIRERGAGVAHCPLSNVYFSGAVFPLRAALAKGVRVGLGTDIAGGPSASMFDAARWSIAASRLLEGGVDPKLGADKRGVADSRIGLPTALHLATAGGADVLGLPVGRFASGFRFDAIEIDLDAEGGPIRSLEEAESETDLVSKIIFGATRANVARVWVDGLDRKRSGAAT